MNDLHPPSNGLSAGAHGDWGGGGGGPDAAGFRSQQVRHARGVGHVCVKDVWSTYFGLHPFSSGRLVGSVLGLGGAAALADSGFRSMHGLFQGSDFF